MVKFFVKYGSALEAHTELIVYTDKPRIEVYDLVCEKVRNRINHLKGGESWFSDNYYPTCIVLEYDQEVHGKDLEEVTW